MTPQEKAKELIDKFGELALIAVDEIQEALQHHSWQNRDWIDYYYEVKAEIEKLNNNRNMKIETFTISDDILMKVFGVKNMDEVRVIEDEERKLMCDCNDMTDSYYVPDGESEVCDKHHWVCYECNKITQIG